MEYLYAVPRFTSKNTMEDTRAYLQRLGNPDKNLKIIHVAGTNGKGSVCAYLRCILEEAGYKVAVFTSPHLVDVRERFIVAGEMISKEAFLEAFLQIYESLDWEKLAQGKGYHPTFFEYLFFMAMLIFPKEKPDYCILANISITAVATRYRFSTGCCIMYTFSSKSSGTTFPSGTIKSFVPSFTVRSLYPPT